MRVLMLTDWFFYYSARIADELVSMGHEVLLVTRDHGLELGARGDATDVKREMLSPGVSLHVLRGRQGSASGASACAGLYIACSRFKPDVVHVQYNRDWRLELVRRWLRKPSIVTVHDITDHPGALIRRNAVQRWAEWSLLNRCDGYIVHGESLRKALRAQDWYNGSEVFSIPHGPLSHQDSSTEPLPECPTALFFGRLETYKGLSVFLDACRLVAARVPGFRAIIAGNGVLGSELLEVTADDPTFDVRIGFVDDADIPGLMASSSVVVLPYTEASQSGVVPIAFANGRAVIASRVGALPEAIDEGRTGWLVEPGDASALADTLLTVFSCPDNLQDAGHEAWTTVTEGRLSAKAVASAHVAAYAAVARVGK